MYKFLRLFGNQNIECRLYKEIFYIMNSQESANNLDFIPFDDLEQSEHEDTRQADEISKALEKYKDHLLNPWMKYSFQIDNFAMRLHVEIIEFFFYIKPKKSENAIRKTVCQKFKSTIEVVLPPNKRRISPTRMSLSSAPSFRASSCRRAISTSSCTVPT